MNKDGKVKISHLNDVVYTLLVLIIGLPLCSQGMAFTCSLLVESSNWFSRDLLFNHRVVVSREWLITLTHGLSIAIFCFSILMLGYLYGKYAPMPKRFIVRYSLFIGSILYTVIVSAVVLYANGSGALSGHLSDLLFWAFLPFFTGSVSQSLSFHDLHVFLLLVFLTYSLFAIGVSLASKQRYPDEPNLGIFRFNITAVCLLLMGLCGYFIAKLG
ncbi:hypothetical protein [Budvicia diplopodorum]|uniref:hypothetical protein n=1 Tax=Budvicia diplopodorum TaxID=1119056 RepID=UPI001358048D|nr:hypothetical protein [Budvicia diplopodorum]